MMHLRHKKTSGQAVLEYVLMILMVVMGIMILYKPMKSLLAVMEQPLRKDFKHVYKYGDPKACGFDDNDDLCSGTPVRHPCHYYSDNFRMFGRK